MLIWAHRSCFSFAPVDCKDYIKVYIKVYIKNYIVKSKAKERQACGQGEVLLRAKLPTRSRATEELAEMAAL